MYSDNARRLIAEMPNRGLLADATHSAHAENPACGDIIKLHLRIGDDTVEDAGFECRGCPGAMAAAAGIAELVKDRPLAECRALGVEELEAYVGQLPSHKHHGFELAIEVLRACLGIRA
jgi:nitrogen fixation NifU-like protein